MIQPETVNEDNEFNAFNDQNSLDDERRKKMKIHFEILKNKKTNLIKSKLWHKIKRKKKEREEGKEYEANKHDVE